MKIGPESFMFCYDFSTCVNLLCLYTPSAPGREGGREFEGRQPPFNRTDKNSTCHLLAPFEGAQYVFHHSIVHTVHLWNLKHKPSEWIPL